MKYALKSVPGLAGWGWPQNSIQMSEGVGKFFQMTNLTIPTNFSFMKYADKSVPGRADDGGPPWGWGWPQNSIQMYGGGVEKVSND